MKLFRIQFLLLSVFVFVGWMAMQQPSANAGQGAEASSAQPSVAPQKGQTAEEQKKDLAECYDIAKAKTGIDPSALLSKKVPGLGEAAAAAGAAGAAPGGAGQGESAQPPAGGQAQGADKQAKLDKFQIANQACLKARGYLVKGQAPATAPAAEQPK
jgi:hypothetical protein